MTRGWALLAALCVCATTLLCPALARAHRVDAAFLSLVEVAPGRFLVKWQAGSSTLEKQTDPAVFPAPCRIEGAHLECGEAGLTGTLEFPWLEGSLTHLVVDIEWRDHSHLLRNVTADTPRLNVYAARGGVRAWLAIAKDYVVLGVEHIATGFDHLLFVLALTLLVAGGRRLLLTVTAFTVAHSLSLAATVLGLVSLPSPPVEASIALSIVLVCVEGVRPKDSLTARAPWAVALAFGLLHGLGFASALLAIGLPEAHLPLALACFNVGVELGQLLIVGIALALAAAGTRLGWQRVWLRPGLYYAMGSVAAAWSLERVTALLGL